MAPEGWEKVGNRVEWVDRESGAAEDDVLHGSRAVKIHRKNAGELDEAEGVMSDFIPVIPRNYELTYEGRTKAWHQPDALFKAGIAEAGRWCRENGVMSLGIMVNPYSHFEFEPAAETLSEPARYTWTHNSAENRETLQQVFKLGLDAGAGAIMLLADDFVPHEGRNRKNFSLYTPEDRKLFVNLQNAQSFLINQLKAWLDRDYPGTRFEFCPPWYANEFMDRGEGKAGTYLKELAAQIPRDVAIIWTGPTVRSLSLDMVDLLRYRDLIDRWPMFWDNTLYARNLETTAYGGYTAHYPGKVRMCNLFEPLDTDRPAAFQTLSDGRHIYVNGAADSEVYRIKFATVADYEWNTLEELKGFCDRAKTRFDQLSRKNPAER